MTSGFAADAAAMAASADRLDEAVDDTVLAARDLEQGAGGDLGPAGIGAAFEQITSSLASTMRAAQADIAAAADVARVAGAAYVGVDEDVAGGLRGITGRGPHAG